MDFAYIFKIHINYRILSEVFFLKNKSDFKYIIQQDDDEKYVEITGLNKRIQSLVIPDTIEGYPVKSIAANAFSADICINSVKIPDTVEIIGDNAFHSCASLNEIDMGKNVLSLGTSVFENCYSLKKIELPQSLCMIGEFAFSGCGMLPKIEIPGSIKVIPQCLFNFCQGLQEVRFCEGVEKIKESVFSNCPSLTLLEIPGSVKEIETEINKSLRESLVVKCLPSSFAERWADEQKLQSKSLFSGLRQLLMDSSVDLSSPDESNELTK